MRSTRAHLEIRADTFFLNNREERTEGGAGGGDGGWAGHPITGVLCVILTWRLGSFSHVLNIAEVKAAPH